MKRKLILLSLAGLLSFNCASAKPTKFEPKQEQVSGENDPLMKLLLSGLIILSVNFLVTK